MEGDLGADMVQWTYWEFQSTPSAWRATKTKLANLSAIKFQSTPSAWRATCTAVCQYVKKAISIHALRMEGDWISTSSSS